MVFAIKVSVIIPVYNVEKYLDRCVMSAIDQSLKDIEVILIDDKSTDSSFEILKKYKDKYNNVKLIQNDRNLGIATSRNIGIENSTGDYILFLESDAYVNLDTIELCYTKAIKNDFDIVTFGVNMFVDDENYNRKDLTNKENFVGEEFFSRYSQCKGYKRTLGFNFFKREFIINNNLKFLSGIIGEEELYVFKAYLLAKNVCYIPKNLHNKITSENPIRTSTNYIQQFDSMKIVVDEMYNFYIDIEDKINIKTVQCIKKYLSLLYNEAFEFCNKHNLQKHVNEFKDNVKERVWNLQDNDELIIKASNNNNLKTKKDILFVMFLLLDGGAEKSLIGILDNLDYSKYNVDLVVLAKERSYLYEINKNVNVSYLYDNSKYMSEDYVNGNFKLRFETKYDIEIGFLGIFTTWIIATFGNSSSQKITWLHGDFSLMSLGNTPEYVNNLYGMMSKIISVSQGVSQSFISFAGDRLQNKLEIIYNPIDINKIRELSYKDINYTKSKFMVLTMGRLAPEKGFDRLIKVHKRLIDEGIEHELLILGDGEEENNLKNLIKHLKLEGTCKIIEYKTNPYPWIRMCDVFVSSSSTEALGLAISEAMVLEKPIVATDTHGSRELFNGNLGLMVGNSEDGIYYGLRTMILNVELRNMYITNLKLIDDFTFDKKIILDKIEKIFDGGGEMISISLCMIVKNEEDVIGRCLDCVKDIVDEIVIVDTGSTDKTKEIVSMYTDKVYDFEWIDDFAAARNYSFSKASKDYIFWIDADEVLFKKDQELLLNLKYTLDKSIDTVTMTDHRGLNENGEPLLRYKRNRLVKRINGFKWVGFIHEFLGVGGKVHESDIAITHQKLNDVGDRNLRIYKKKLAQGHELSTRDVYYYGKELYYNGYYEEAIKILEPFTKMKAWDEEKIDAQCKISDCYISKGDYINARKSLYETFEYTTPRAEVLFRLANTFKNEGRYEEAISWYEYILQLKMPEESYGFLSPEDWTWKPHLQLSVCYYNINNLNKSKYHHKKAYAINPKNHYIAKNEEFFNTLD